MKFPRAILAVSILLIPAAAPLIPAAALAQHHHEMTGNGAAPMGMAGMDHGAKPDADGGIAGMAGMEGMKPTPKGLQRQTGGPAEAALQAFSDALDVGNRDLAAQWLAPDARIVENGAEMTRQAYIGGRMDEDMRLRKDAKLVLVDRQVLNDRPGGTRVMSTIRLIANRSDKPFDITLFEVAMMRRSPDGWRVERVEWSPAREEGA